MDMGGMDQSMSNTNTTGGGMTNHMMTHMTFFWGKNSEILFDGWPGTRTGMYVLALITVFFFAIFVELLSHCKMMKPGSTNLGAGLIQTFLYALRIGLAYLVMLAVMSFNVGVFLVALAGHTVGFLLFGSRVFKKSPTQLAKTSDLAPMSC